jgi:hypothetical protein
MGTEADDPIRVALRRVLIVAALAGIIDAGQYWVFPCVGHGWLAALIYFGWLFCTLFCGLIFVVCVKRTGLRLFGWLSFALSALMAFHWLFLQHMCS